METNHNANPPPVDTETVEPVSSESPARGTYVFVRNFGDWPRTLEVCVSMTEAESIANEVWWADWSKVFARGGVIVARRVA